MHPDAVAYYLHPLIDALKGRKWTTTKVVQEPL